MDAAYLQLYKELKKQIISGAYSYGERFPSKRITAKESGFSLITVQHAYEILCDDWEYATVRSFSPSLIKVEGRWLMDRVTSSALV